jgi:hypothetical protein
MNRLEGGGSLSSYAVAVLLHVIYTPNPTTIRAVIAQSV